MLSGMHRFNTTNRHSPILHCNRPSLRRLFTRLHQPRRLASHLPQFIIMHFHMMPRPQLLCVRKINAAFRNSNAIR
eukprot:scaffold10780_cov78-Cyclotella_meneghiniana.AAC.25